MLTEAQQELRRLWIEALRSGKYKQGQGQLRLDDGSFCCLGVLCDLIDPNGWGIDSKKHTWIRANTESTYFLRDELLDEIGLRFHDANKLTKMNDDKIEPKTFTDIADAIEKLGTE